MTEKVYRKARRTPPRAPKPAPVNKRLRSLAPGYVYDTVRQDLRYQIGEEPNYTWLRAGMVVYVKRRQQTYYSKLYAYRNKLVDQYLRPIEKLVYITWTSNFEAEALAQMDTEFMARVQADKKPATPK